MEEIARLLRRSSGRCAIISQTYEQLLSCLDSVYFTDIKVRGINVGGYVCALITAKRSGAEFKRVKVTHMYPPSISSTTCQGKGNEGNDNNTHDEDVEHRDKRFKQ